MRYLTDLELKCVVYNASPEYYSAAGDPNTSSATPYVAKNPFSLPQPLCRRGFWRTSEEIINDILGPAATQRTAVSLAPTRRSPYLGLRNLGASCYMNAYIQCLFLNYDFRNELYAAWEALDSKYQLASWPANTSTLNEMARLFATLQHGAVSVGDPAGMARALCVSGRTQEDATELATLLLNALETELTSNGLSTGLVNLFKGTMQHSVTCIECHNVSKRSESFQELRVQVPRYVASRAHTGVISESEAASDDSDASVVVEVHATAQSEICQRAKRRQQPSNSRSNVTGRHQVLQLERLLQQVFRKESLKKQNQYECSTCGKKVDAVKEVKLESNPQYLQICFERYKFDAYSGERTKLLNTIRFPLQLDISNFVLQGRPKRSVKYTLMAVLEHIGHSAVSGHYRAKVRDCAFRSEIEKLADPPPDGKPKVKSKTEHKIKAEKSNARTDDNERTLSRAATQSEQLSLPRRSPRRCGSATPPPSFRFSERIAAQTSEENGAMTCPTKRAASATSKSSLLTSNSPYRRAAPRTPRSQLRVKRRLIPSTEAITEDLILEKADYISKFPGGICTSGSLSLTNNDGESREQVIHKRTRGLQGGEKAGSEAEEEHGSPMMKRRRVQDNGEQNLGGLQLFHKRWREDGANRISLDDPSRHEWIEFDDQTVRSWQPQYLDTDTHHLMSESAYLFVYRKLNSELGDIDYIPSRLLTRVTSLIDETAQSIEQDQRCREELHNLCDQVRARLSNITSVLQASRRQCWDLYCQDKSRFLSDHCFIPRYILHGLLTGQDYELMYSVFRESPYVTVIRSVESPHLGILVSSRVAEARKDEAIDCNRCTTPVNERLCSHGKVDPLLVVEGHYKLVPKFFLEQLNLASSLVASDYMCHSCCDLIYACALTSLQIQNVFQRVWATATTYEKSNDSADSSSVVNESQKSDMLDEEPPSSPCLIIRVRTLLKLDAVLTMYKHDGKKRSPPRLGTARPLMSMNKETVFASVGAVRKSLIHLRKRCFQSPVQDHMEKLVDPLELDQHLICTHGLLITAKRMRTAKVSATLMQKLSDLEDARSDLMFKFLDFEKGVEECESIRRFSKPNDKCIVYSDDASLWCGVCTDDVRSRHNVRIFKKLPEHRKQLPPGHYDMLFNPRLFMLAELDQRGRRYFQSFPATGIHYAINAEWLSQLITQSAVNEKQSSSSEAPLTSDPATDADISPGPWEHVLQEINLYFTEAQRNACHKFWWQPVFHHFSADLPVGSTGAVFGGYLVYNPSIHGVSPITQEIVRSVVLIPETTLSILMDILGIPQRPCRAAKLRICRYPLTYKQVLDCSETPDIEQPVDDAFYNSLRVLNLDAAAPDCPQPHLNILIQTQLSESRSFEGGLIAAVDTTRIVPVNLPYDGLVEFSLVTFTMLRDDC